MVRKTQNFLKEVDKKEEGCDSHTQLCAERRKQDYLASSGEHSGEKQRFPGSFQQFRVVTNLHVDPQVEGSQAREGHDVHDDEVEPSDVDAVEEERTKCESRTVCRVEKEMRTGLYPQSLVINNECGSKKNVYRGKLI